MQSGFQNTGLERWLYPDDQWGEKELKGFCDGKGVSHREACMEKGGYSGIGDGDGTPLYAGRRKDIL